jgi:DNA repair photolyase
MVQVHLASTDKPRGRGAQSNETGRFERLSRVLDLTSEADDDEARKGPKTEIRREVAKSIVSTNDSPDLSFDQSLNPYRGCEHGCIYCYARPTHAYLGHSPGLEFETLIYAKTNAAALLETALSKPGYVPKSFALGAVTDPYQPIERTLGITRQLLEVLERTQHPVGIVTKSASIVRDIDILARMAERGLVKVALSVTTLDRDLARAMEPRAATPERRLQAVRRLSEAGVPVSAMVAPIIPALNDHEIEAILAQAAAMGAREAGYVLLRLPLELKDLFREWLATYVPDRANRILAQIRNMHGGRDYNPAFGARQKGSGPFAELLAQRFRLSLARHGLNARGRLALRTDLFRPPSRSGQMELF